MTATLLTWGVRAALAVALVGVIGRVAIWLRGRTPAAPPPAPTATAGAAPRGARRRPGRALLRALRGALVDVLGQRRLLARDPVRGLAHLAVAVGVTFLVLLHALHAVVTEKLFSGYASTLNPWLWLRDLAGLLVVGGLVVGALRRRRARRRAGLPPLRRRDPVLLGLLAVLLGSGFFLGAVKILSAPAFERMVRDYSSHDPGELAPLRQLWTTDFGVVFPPATAPAAPGAAARPATSGAPTATRPAGRAAGAALHEESCAGCHSRPQAAFVSYPLSRALRPAALPLARGDAAGGLLALHLLTALLALAYLPYGRLVHLVADPAALVTRAAAPPDGAPPTPRGAARRRVLALDACVACGLCDERCSVRAFAALTGDGACLPSAKVAAARRLRHAPAPDADLTRLAVGAFACTECGRCARDCPVGLDLDDLWAAGRAHLDALGEPPPAVWVRSHAAAEWAARLTAAPAPAGPALVAAVPELAVPVLTTDRRTFSPCVQCQTCTNVCPVVAASGGDGGVDATPQRVMNLLRLGLVELALGSRMVWDCATCYQCQEHCPAGIRVTDVLYELRQRAYARLDPLRARRAPATPRPDVPGGVA